MRERFAFTTAGLFRISFSLKPICRLILLLEVRFWHGPLLASQPGPTSLWSESTPLLVLTTQNPG